MCSPCYKARHSPPCARCKKDIRGEFVEVRGSRYCKACFSCAHCDTVFTREEKKGAYPVGDELLCYNCALTTRRAEMRAKREAQARAEEEAAAEAERLAREAAAAKAAEIAAMKAEEEAAAKAQAEQDRLAAEAAEAELSRRRASIMATQAQELADREAQQALDKEETVTENTLAMPEVNSSGFIRQGTTRASRLPRRGSKQGPTPEQRAAIQAAMEEEDADEAEDETSGGGSVSTDSQSEVQGAVTSEPEPVAEGTEDPFSSLWAGFSIPAKLSKFTMDIPGREVLDIGSFTVIDKKFKACVFVIICTDVVLLTQKIDDDCYELMTMPVLRNKVKASIVKKLAGVPAMKIKGGKTMVLKCASEEERAFWIGKLNAPVGFIPTKALG